MILVICNHYLITLICHSISGMCSRATFVFRSTPAIFVLRQSNYLSISIVLNFNSICWYMLTVFFINVNQFGSVYFSTCSSVVNFSLCVTLTMNGSSSSHYKLPRNNKYHMIRKSRSYLELKNLHTSLTHSKYDQIIINFTFIDNCMLTPHHFTRNMCHWYVYILLLQDHYQPKHIPEQEWAFPNNLKWLQWFQESICASLVITLCLQFFWPPYLWY